MDGGLGKTCTTKCGDKVMIRLKDILLESVYDKTSLKAVIMSGGPGSGKTYMARKLFGFDDTLQKVNLSSYGMKRIDSDYFYVDLLTKAGYDLNLAKMRSDPKLKDIDDVIRAAAIEKSKKQKHVMIDSRLGVILDTTSSDMTRVLDNKKELEEKGYDVICVFIDVPLEVALQRNRTRDRKLPEKLVEEMWHECQENKKELQNIFGSNFYVIKDDNVNEIQKRLNKFLAEPIRNPIGKAWIELQLKLKDRLNK